MMEGNDDEKRVVCIFMSLLFLLYPIVNVVAFASEDCLEEFFTGLTENDGNEVPPNAIGSCSYVAMSMLLMYYDTYWNGTIVPDELEWDSGRYNSSEHNISKPITSNSEVDEWDGYIVEGHTNLERKVAFGNFVNDTQGEYLQAHLIQIGRNEYSAYYSSISKWFGTRDYIVMDVLYEYLYTYREFTESQIEIWYAEGSIEELIPIMTQQIDNGFPVLYFANGYPTASYDCCGDDCYNTPDDGGKSGHAMVAYGYDSSGDILLHTGYNNNTRKTTLSETCYNIAPSIIWLEIKNLPHECDDNYADSVNPETIKYCACQVYGDHPSHGTNHLFTMNNCDSQTHWIECSCGEKNEIRPHDIFCYNKSIDTHNEVCLDCLYTRLSVPHYKYSTEDNNTGTHDVYCICGEMIGTEDHYVSGYQYNSIANHYKVCSCGKLMGREVHTPVNKLGKTYCSGCLCRLDGSGNNLVNGGKDDPEALLE